MRATSTASVCPPSVNHARVSPHGSWPAARRMPDGLAVIGHRRVDSAIDSKQLADIGETVRQQSGFVRGLGGHLPDDLVWAHAHVVFGDEPAAEDRPMASGQPAA